LKTAMQHSSSAAGWIRMALSTMLQQPR
jgi:hypothetical protein